MLASSLETGEDIFSIIQHTVWFLTDSNLKAPVNVRQDCKQMKRALCSDTSMPLLPDWEKVKHPN